MLIPPRNMRFVHPTTEQELMLSALTDLQIPPKEKEKKRREKQTKDRDKTKAEEHRGEKDVPVAPTAACAQGLTGLLYTYTHTWKKKKEEKK